MGWSIDFVTKEVADTQVPSNVGRNHFRGPFPPSKAGGWRLGATGGKDEPGSVFLHGDGLTLCTGWGR